MFGTSDYEISVAETATFRRDAKRLLSDEERENLIDHLAHNPEAGDIVPSSGGVRKLRWGMGNRGKRRGARVIYYFRDLNMPLYLLAAYAKSSKIDLSEAEWRTIRKLVDELVEHHARKRWARLASEST